MSVNKNSQFETPPPSDLFDNMNLDPAAMDELSAPAPSVSPDAVDADAAQLVTGSKKFRKNNR